MTLENWEDFLRSPTVSPIRDDNQGMICPRCGGERQRGQRLCPACYRKAMSGKDKRRLARMEDGIGFGARSCSLCGKAAIPGRNLCPGCARRKWGKRAYLQTKRAMREEESYARR